MPYTACRKCGGGIWFDDSPGSRAQPYNIDDMTPHTCGEQTKRGCNMNSDHTISDSDRQRYESLCQRVSELRVEDLEYVWGEWWYDEAALSDLHAADLIIRAVQRWLVDNGWQYYVDADYDIGVWRIAADKAWSDVDVTEGYELSTWLSVAEQVAGAKEGQP